MANNNENIGQGVENQEETTELSLETPEQEAARLAASAEEVVAKNREVEASLTEKSEEENAEIARLTAELHGVTDANRAQYARASEVDAMVRNNNFKRSKDPILSQAEDITGEDKIREDAYNEDYKRTANNPLFPHVPGPSEGVIKDLKEKLGL